MVDLKLLHQEYFSSNSIWKIINNFPGWPPLNTILFHFHICSKYLKKLTNGNPAKIYNSITMTSEVLVCAVTSLQVSMSLWVIYLTTWVLINVSDLDPLPLKISCPIRSTNINPVLSRLGVSSRKGQGSTCLVDQKFDGGVPTRQQMLLCILSSV